MGRSLIANVGTFCYMLHEQKGPKITSVVYEYYSSVTQTQQYVDLASPCTDRSLESVWPLCILLTQICQMGHFGTAIFYDCISRMQYDIT